MKYEDQRKQTPFTIRDNILDIRTHITELAFRGFGKRPRTLPKQPRNWNEWSKESQLKWTQTQEQKLHFMEQCDAAFISDEFKWFNNTLRYIVSLIDQAYTLKPQSAHEYTVKRDLQNKTIGLCSNLKRELNFIADTIPCNQNYIILVTKELDNEINLLVAWRDSKNIG